MENQDIFNQFKKAADNAETPNFPGMEKVWQNVEGKLDKKLLKKEKQLWKKWAVAASVLLGLSIGYQFLKQDSTPIHSNEIITQKDSVPAQLKAAPNSAVVSAEPRNPLIKPEADKILEHHLSTNANVVAMEESVQKGDNATDSITVKINANWATESDKVYGAYKTEKVSAKKADTKDIELFFNDTKATQDNSTKKEEALIVYDNLVKNKQGLKSVDPEEVESIVILKEPLYIINGVEYTEKEVFGPNPTSPYTPLHEQDIDSISVFQNDEAVDRFGEKGKKGVVIIHTKDGKPKKKGNTYKIQEQLKKNN